MEQGSRGEGSGREAASGTLLGPCGDLASRRPTPALGVPCDRVMSGSAISEQEKERREHGSRTSHVPTSDPCQR